MKAEGGEGKIQTKYKDLAEVGTTITRNKNNE